MPIIFDFFSYHRFLELAVMIIALVFPFTTAYAIEPDTLPAGEKVVFGEAYFDRDTPNTLSIKQGSERLFIDWHQGFNIGEKASVIFNQPSNQSIVVNRVVGKFESPTQILGEITANGTVVILDRNGVIFDKSSRIDVGSLIVSTGKIGVKQFASDEKRLTIKNATQGEIINRGSITVADAGLAAFVAPNVRNDGVIVVRQGTVLMGPARVATFDLYGDRLFEIAIGKKYKKMDVQNNGKIDTEGGAVFVSAAYIKDSVSQLVNMNEIAKGETFRVHNGKIIIGEVKPDPLPEPEPAPAPAPVSVPAPVVINNQPVQVSDVKPSKDRGYRFILKSHQSSWNYTSPKNLKNLTQDDLDLMDE